MWLSVRVCMCIVINFHKFHAVEPLFFTAPMPWIYLRYMASYRFIATFQQNQIERIHPLIERIEIVTWPICLLSMFSENERLELKLKSY